MGSKKSKPEVSGMIEVISMPSYTKCSVNKDFVLHLFLRQVLETARGTGSIEDDINNMRKLYHATFKYDYANLQEINKDADLAIFGIRAIWSVMGNAPELECVPINSHEQGWEIVNIVNPNFTDNRRAVPLLLIAPGLTR